MYATLRNMGTMNVDFTLSNPAKLKKELGLDDKRHHKLNAILISRLREKMPRKSGIMSANTREDGINMVVVATPYAHYQNVGEIYIDPVYKKGAFFNQNYGFWSRPGVKKIPSGRKFATYGGDKGPLFVERTLAEKKDIIERVKK